MSSKGRPSLESPGDPGFFLVNAKVVAVGCLVITAAAVACLIVVISVGESSNTLASTALAFGLVAFISQLVIATAQFASAEKTRIESNRIGSTLTPEQFSLTFKLLHGVSMSVSKA